MRRNRGARKSRRIQVIGRKSGSPAAVPTRREGRRLTRCALERIGSHRKFVGGSGSEGKRVTLCQTPFPCVVNRMGGVLCGAEVAILVKSPAEIRGRNSGSTRPFEVMELHELEEVLVLITFVQDWQLISSRIKILTEAEVDADERLKVETGDDG
ncbi:hypothetical protein Salat_0031100 [Sesamum alatum]|uniref:Uncharacterized protein n=1 Tax=Sesamum alatum TaxID=300844 RepID=A0AAE1YVN7_9LAMI|nr:hypothetical protein Salat_0031100 [Sesamum alatum]